jgi:hypothetical protein
MNRKVINDRIGSEILTQEFTFSVACL